MVWKLSEMSRSGFKHIAAEVDARGSDCFVFAAEESIGFMAGDYCRDKDAAIGALYVLELATELKRRGQTLLDRLEELHAQHGFHREQAVSLISRPVWPCAHYAAHTGTSQPATGIARTMPVQNGSRLSATRSTRPAVEFQIATVTATFRRPADLQWQSQRRRDHAGDPPVWNGTKAQAVRLRQNATCTGGRRHGGSCHRVPGCCHGRNGNVDGRGAVNFPLFGF